MESSMSKNRNARSVATVVLDTHINKTLDYLIPEKLLGSLKQGQRVKVPVRAQIQNATVLEIKEKSSFPKLRPIRDIFSDISLPQDLLELSMWMAKYYMAPLSKVFKCIVPATIRNETKLEERIWLTLKPSKKKVLEIVAQKQRSARSQATVLEFMLTHKKGVFLKELIEETKVSRGVIDALAKAKILNKEKQIVNINDLLKDEEYFLSPAKKLTEEQQTCFDAIAKSIDKKQFDTHLIFGVTGSGKTEIYMQAMQKTLAQKQSALLLMPEIALTSQMIERFRSRFKEQIAIIHHQRTMRQRMQDWQDLRSGKIHLVIGARSAVFSPVQNLGLIIVDEEHESSYKQAEEAPFYNARDLAVMRGKMNSCPVVLGSATPSIESFYNTQNHKYRLSTLSKRPTSHSLPTVKVVSMTDEMKKTGGFTHFSEPLIDGIKERYKKGEQTLLFLNRRGYQTTLMCLSCENTVKCPHCDLCLTFHKKAGCYKCHLCDYQVVRITECPSCGSSETFKLKGFGTEHVQSSLHALFPEIRSIRLDRDTTTKKGSIDKAFKEFRSGKADVLIGTQMIAKGLHFPSVTLVGVLNADAHLNIPDFRASEQVFQKIVQVSGRSGRSDIPGEVIIQTMMPNHPTIIKAANQDYLSFYQSEVEERQLFHYPPFCQLIRLVFSGKAEEETQAIASRFREVIAQHLPENYSALNVNPCGYAKVKDRYRFQFILKGASVHRMQAAIYPAFNKVQHPSYVRITIDVNPLSTYL